MEKDEIIQKNVLEELKWEPAVNAAEIGVAVNDGIVTLSGSVNYYPEKMAAEAAAKRVRGVRGIALDIQVQLDHLEVSDTSIAESVVRAMEWSTNVPDDRIRVHVDNGWVSLEGEVDRLYDKEAVEEVLGNISGIRGITNKIRVRPAPAIEKMIAEKIRQALQRSAELEADVIHVQTEGTRVLLKGAARSWNEREAIRKAAASAPGVSEVIDQLSVVY